MKKMNFHSQKKVGLIFSIIFFATACGKLFVSPYNNIEVHNVAAFDIYVVPGYGKGWWMSAYPQTGLPSNRPNLIRVGKNSNNFIQSGVSWEDIFKEMPKDTLSIYFFNADTVDAKPWSIIQRAYSVLKRKDYTLESLKAVNFQITYP